MLTIAAVLYFGVSPLAYAQSSKGANPAWAESYKHEAGGKCAQVALAIKSVLRDSPNNDFALMRRAWLNYLQGRHNDAVRDYGQALVLNPRSIKARLALSFAAALKQSEALRQSILKKTFSGQLVPQDPTDEPAARLLERICAERENAAGQSRSPRKVSKRLTNC